jgi:hypothetical protein
VTDLYVRAGLLAEGRTDYRFLLPLLDRLLIDLLAQHFPSRHTHAPSLGIGADAAAGPRGASQIADAIAEHWNQCFLFVVHADGAGDPGRERANNITPGVLAAEKWAREAGKEEPVLVAACVPVREIEAWMLADLGAFKSLLGSAAPTALPGDPERVLDPKRELRRLLGDRQRRHLDAYDYFGVNVALDALRRLPAFIRFEVELLAAVRGLAAQHQ